MMIENMEQLQALARAGETNWTQYGDVRAVYHDGLVLFNYTQACQYAGRWNWFEQQSRGLILNATTGEIVARPFPKFFNLGERTPAAGTTIDYITEKWDGSLGILFWHSGQYHVATRGSFTGEQAQWATNWFRSNYRGMAFPEFMHPEYTFLFEIIYPQNRIVVDYGDTEDMVMLAAIEKADGSEMGYEQMKSHADWYQFKVAKRYEFNTLEDILNAAKTLPTNAEGWVIRMSDGTRFKVKGDAYILAHRLLSEVTFKRILNTVAAGTYAEMIDGVPDEFLSVVKEYKAEIDSKVRHVQGMVKFYMEGIPATNDRKTLALWVQQNVKRDYHSYMFATFDSRDIVPMIYKQAFKDRIETSATPSEGE